MNNMYESDEEITDPSEDFLNIDRFAKHLAHTISINNFNHLTIGIIGSWGSGKSSLINLTLKPLEKEFIIIRFDPWFISNQNNLYLQFFKSIIDAFKKEEIKKENIFESKIKSKRKLFDKQNSTLENYFNYIKDSSDELKINISEYILNSDNLKSYNSLEFHKKQCENYFKEFNSKVIIIIDNIDRLRSDEIVQIFTLVKSLADFKQFIYILSFDKEIVSKALKDMNFEDKKYLDKIVQIPIIVPKISESKIDEMIMAKIEPIYKNHLEKFNSNYQFNKIIDFLKLFIKDIRDLKRYKNILMFYIDAFAYDLNIDDFFLILAIQLFNYELYLKIKENEYSLTIDKKEFEDNKNVQLRLPNSDKDFKEIVGDENWIEFKHLFIHLFPKLNAKNNPLTYEKYVSLEKNRNIATKDHFEKYFTLTLDNNNVSEVLIERLIKLKDIDEIYYIFTYNNNPDYNHSLLTQFRKSIPQIPNNNIIFFIKALMKCGDELKTYIHTRRVIEWILEDLLTKTTNDVECFNILNECIDYENNILTVLECIYQLAFEYGLAGLNKSIKTEEEMPIKIEQVKKLISKTIKDVRKSSENNEFINHPFLQDILSYWELLDNEEIVKDYVLRNVNTNEEILSFLSKFRTIQRTTHSLSGGVSKSRMVLDLKKLDKYHGLKFYEEKVNEILMKDSLKPEEKELCDLFTEEYEEYKIKFQIE